MSSRGTDPASPLGRALTYAAHASAYYKELDWAFALRNGRMPALSEIPITPKHVVRENTQLFYCRLAGEGLIHETHTSGSSGEPMLVKKSNEATLMADRESVKFERGWALTRQATWLEAKRWKPGKPPKSSQMLPNGCTLWTIRSQRSDVVAEALVQTSASHFMGLPTTALAILESDIDLSFLRVISTFGETVQPELEARIAALPNCRHRDRYASEETGVIAALCPTCRQYHPADEHLVVEILDETDAPARPGAWGRVVLTNLYNRAMPLVRYEIGDVAIAAKARCIRGRPIFAKVLGRERQLFKLPSGGRVAPGISAKQVFNMGIKRFKLVQTTLQDVELHYIPAGPHTVITTEQAQKLVDEGLSPEYRARPVAMTEFPVLPSGKSPMHECLV